MILQAESIATTYGHTCYLTPTEADGPVFRWWPESEGEPGYEVNASRAGVMISGLIDMQRGEAVEELCYLLALASAVAHLLDAGDLDGAWELVWKAGR